MANVKITELPAVVTITPGTDVVALVSGGTTKKATPSQIVSYALNAATAIGIGGVPGADAKVEVAGTYPSSGAVSRVIRANGIIPSTTTGTARLFGAESNTQAAVFNITALQHFCALQSSMGAGSTVTNQYGYLVDASLTGATNNYGFYGGIAAGTGKYNLYMAGTAANYLAGDLQLAKTVTAGGTTGAQTINKTTGTVNFAAAATSLVVTNSLVTTSSIIIATVGTNNTAMKSVQVVAAAGSFTIYANAAATAETRVNFLITN